MKQLFLIIIIACCIINNSQAQDNCKVLVDALNGSYTGECQNGKANGFGKAVGIDTFDGQFIKGYPEGKGVYIWKDGHYYIGIFKKGKMEGAGDMYFEGHKGQDSVITGFWKKDKYLGEYEHDYVVAANTSRITKIECTLVEKGDNGGINVTSTNSSGAPPIVSNITVLAGQFNNKTENNTNNSGILRLKQMIFPFRAIFYLSDGQNFEILFNEKGNYEVVVTVI